MAVAGSLRTTGNVTISKGVGILLVRVLEDKEASEAMLALVEEIFLQSESIFQDSAFTGIS